MGAEPRPIPNPAVASPAATPGHGARWGRPVDRQLGRPRTRLALIAVCALCGAVVAQGSASSADAEREANASFDAAYASGLRALQAGEPSKAYRRFTRCQRSIEAMSPARRPIATFVTGLFLAETRLLAGQVEASAIHAELLGVAESARASGAWTADRCDYFRLRALLLLSRTTSHRAFAAELPESDRRWLLRDRFAVEASPRLRPLLPAALVLRFRLTLGTEGELSALRDLVGAEAALRARVEAGEELAPDEREWHTILLQELATYHARRHSFDRARIYLGRMPDEASLVLRAWLALQSEDNPQAIALAEKLLAAGDPIGHQIRAEALETSGRAAEALVDYDAALRAASDPGAVSAAQNGRGDCLLRLGRLEEAAAAYDEALRASEGSEVGLMAEHAETCKDLGRLLERRGEPGRALARYLESLEIGERVRTLLLRDPFGGSWLGTHGDQRTAIDGVLRTWQSAGGDGWQMLRALELGRARGALDLATGRAAPLEAEVLRDLVAARLSTTDPTEVESLEAQLDALRANHETRAAPAEVPDPSALEQFARAHGDTTMLLWWLGREEAFLLAVRGRRVEAFPLPDPAVCRRMTAAAYRAVATPDGDASALGPAADALLPSEVRPWLGETVLAVLDPDMARLPLEALVIDGSPLGARVRLVRAPSLAVAMLLGERRRRGRGVLIVRAPERTELTDRLGLDPLRFAGAEVEAVAEAWPAHRILRAKEASVATLCDPEGAAAGPWDVVHLTAHAIDCPGLPTQSLLLLADGPLAMGGLPSIGFGGVLLVLSSCAAAVGEARGDEGVIGLVEGAFAAGARGVVAPVAAVNQQATADFMRCFHEELGRGGDPATALRDARRRMAGIEAYAHPHYWGSFTLFAGLGSPAEPLAPARGSAPVPRWVYVGLALLLLGLGVWLLLPGKHRVVRLR